MPNRRFHAVRFLAVIGLAAGTAGFSSLWGGTASSIQSALDSALQSKLPVAVHLTPPSQAPG